MGKEEKSVMKNKKGIIIAAIVIAILLAGILVISNIGTEKEEPIQNAAQTNSIYSEEASSLAEVKVTTAEGEIRAVNTGKSDWTINDLPQDEIDPQKAYSLAGTVSTIISKNVYENVSDLSQYGLDNPRITVTITKKNGESDTLYVGDISPTLGEYFIMLDGDDNVYTLYSYKVDALLKPLEYYKEFNRFNVNIDDITGVRIEREGSAVEIKLKDKDKQSIANVWEMTEPYESSANDDYIDNKILAPIGNITLSKPIENNTVPFTDEPITLTITVKPYNNETGRYGKEYTETMLIEDINGENTRVIYKDKLYETPSESVAFAEESAFNIVSKLQAMVDISYVRSVEVEYGSEKHTLGVEREGESKYSFTLDGKEADAKASQEIYRNIIALAVDAVYEGGEKGDTLLKLTFNALSSDDGTSVVEIKQLDDLSCVMERDGKAEFTIKKSKVDEFITLFDAYVKAHE